VRADGLSLPLFFTLGGQNHFDLISASVCFFFLIYIVFAILNLFIAGQPFIDLIIFYQFFCEPLAIVDCLLLTC